MIKDIVDGICGAISERFAGCEIYTEKVKQGMAPPCFFVRCIDQEDDLEVQRIFKKRQFGIQYFPESDDEPNAECHTTAEGLFACLELIKADGAWVRGTDMSGHVEDGVLTFTVNYGVFVCSSKDQPSMEQVTVDTEVEG